MIKIFCDHCGKELDAIKDKDHISIDFEGDFFPCDLCAECYNYIINNITNQIKEFIGDTKNDK